MSRLPETPRSRTAVRLGVHACVRVQLDLRSVVEPATQRRTGSIRGGITANFVCYDREKEKRFPRDFREILREMLVPV